MNARQYRLLRAHTRVRGLLARIESDDPPSLCELTLEVEELLVSIECMDVII